MTDEEKERARRLREEIAQLGKRKSAPSPRTPREFVEEQMRKRDNDPEDGREPDSGSRREH